MLGAYTNSRYDQRSLSYALNRVFTSGNVASEDAKSFHLCPWVYTLFLGAICLDALFEIELTQYRFSAKH